MLHFMTFLGFSLGAFGLILLKHLFSPKPAIPFPPGPRPLPLIGNLFDMPSERQWETFSEWGKRWGDMVSLSILGKRIIIVNSAQIAIDMMDKKSAFYSDRPVLHMGGELVGWRESLALIPYGDHFRNIRKMFHQLIGSHASMKEFFLIEEAETHRFLKRLLVNPEDFLAHIRTTAGAIILLISYGYEVEDERDPLVELADRAIEQFSMSTAPGGFLVDQLPALKYVPAWIPGAGFKKKAKIWRTCRRDTADVPYNFVKQQMASGTAKKSFTSTLLEKKNLSPEEEYTIKWAAESLYAGGADTTVSLTHSFFLAMCLYPEVQERAQEEIDDVVGSDRLPKLDDRKGMPYMDALCQEVFRWHTLAPTGLPHLVMKDDVHEGYLIPKGAVVIPNIWQMLHDPKIYSNPMAFDPSRFIASDKKKPERDPREMCFGFGRRVCPGRILADASIFASCAMTLAVFHISKCVEDGIIIEPVVDQTSGTISHPYPFKCSIRARSEKAVALIQAEGH